MIAKISVFLVIVGLLSYFQMRRIRSKGDKKGALAYCFLMSLAAVVGVMLIAGVKMPSQSTLTKIFEPIGKAVLGE